jgi:hypothetical protein
MDKRLDRPDKIKSLCEGYHIDNELDHARLLTYTETIGVGKMGPKMARDQFFGEYPKPPRINRRQGPSCSSDRLDLYTANGTEEEQVKRNNDRQQ